MCDQGHKVTFDSQKCKIRKEGSRKLVATTARTSSNIYVLRKIGNEKCFPGKEDESWLWHRRMGHMNFDNLFKWMLVDGQLCICQLKLLFTLGLVYCYFLFL